MATYKNAIRWIALNDAAGDTPDGASWDTAFEVVKDMISVCMVTDLWHKEQSTVAEDVLRARGFRKPRHVDGR
jgi:hypothetical protein